MILCCGEALIDMIPEPTKNGVDGFVPHCGGAIFNTAIALGRLGAPAGMLSGLSSDMFGQKLRAALAADGVDTSRVISSPRPTTLAFVELVDGHASYQFYDENSAGRMITATDLPALGDDVALLYFGGISLACEPGADAYAALLDAEGTERAVMIDPNIRPGFIANEARYRARLDRMFAFADVVKVSDEDLDWLLPGDSGLEGKARAFLDKGPAIVIVTQGSKGAAAYLRGGDCVAVPAPRTQVVDTVGAGDTFNAGFLAKIAELGHLGKPDLRAAPSGVIKDALAFGAQVAAVTVSRAGANPPYLNEV